MPKGENFEITINMFGVWNLPWQGAIFWLPLPMLIIRICSTIFYTRKLSFYIWTRYVSVDGLY